MRITTRQTQGVVIAKLSGRLIAGSDATAFRGRIKGLLDAGSSNIVLDLAGVDMMDSSGLGELTSAQRGAAAGGGGVVLLNVTGEVRRVLELARVASGFAIYDDEIDAVTSFRR